MKKRIIDFLICITFPVVLGLVLTLGFSFIILKTNISENFESAFMLMITAIVSIYMTILFVIKTNIKPIICFLLSFVFMSITKFIVTILIHNVINFSNNSIVSLLFTCVFCFIGSLIGANIKK